MRCPNCDMALEPVIVEPARAAKLDVRPRYPSLATLLHTTSGPHKLTAKQADRMTTLCLDYVKDGIAGYWCVQGEWVVRAKYEGTKLVVFGFEPPRDYLNGMEVVDMEDLRK